MSPLTLRETGIYTALSLATRAPVAARAKETRARLEWPAARMAAFRLERARQTLRHAAAHVPYYRELFGAHGFDPARFASFDDLARLPPLTRDALIAAGAALRDEHADPASMSRVSTGGTTGTPVTVYLDRATASERMLVNHRMYAAMGRSLGSPTLMLAGSPIDFNAWSSARDRLKNRLFGVTVRSSFNLTPDEVERTLREISSGRYRWVLAYASVFDILSAAAGPGFRRPERLSIIPCAELVTAAQRERWREVLGAEVFEIYGSREMSSMAGELPDHRGMLVNGDLYHLEIADGAGNPLPPGSPGLITVTTLLERGMPLLRYQLGDVGTLLPPEPGDRFPFPRLTISHGRVLDVICCPDGKLLPGEFFPHLMKEVQAEVRRFQVVQTALDQLEVRVVARESFTDATRDYLLARLRERTGEEMALRITLVDEIETSASGKFRPTISHVPLEEKVRAFRRG